MLVCLVEALLRSNEPDRLLAPQPQLGLVVVGAGQFEEPVM